MEVQITRMGLAEICRALIAPEIKNTPMQPLYALAIFFFATRREHFRFRFHFTSLPLSFQSTYFNFRHSTTTGTTAIQKCLLLHIEGSAALSLTLPGGRHSEVPRPCQVAQQILPLHSFLRRQIMPIPLLATTNVPLLHHHRQCSSSHHPPMLLTEAFGTSVPP